jgi:RNA polymerase sigma-70 factor (family 1)
MDIESKEILDDLAVGNEQGYKKLFYSYYRKLCIYAESFVANRDIAEDIVQDTFYSIWEKRHELNIESSLKSYLYRSIHNGCIHYLRHLKVQEKHSKFYSLKLNEAQLLYNLNTDSTSSGLYRNELETMIKNAIESLPEKTRDIFLLSREKGLKNQIIADKLNLTVKSIEYHVSKALETLREDLKDYLVVFYLLLYLTFG